MTVNQLLFIGVAGYVWAIDRPTGTTVWKTRVFSNGGIVTVLPDVDSVFAAASGYLYRLDALTGAELWQIPLTGMGFNMATLATSRAATVEALLGRAANTAVVLAAQQDEERRASSD